MQVFVPLSDELLYERTDSVPADCRPYQCGMICAEWLAAAPAPPEAQPHGVRASREHCHDE